MHENELSKDAPKEVAHDTSRIVDTGYHVLPHAPSSQQVLGQILGEFMVSFLFFSHISNPSQKYANELEKHVVEKSTMPGGKGVSTDEIVNIFRGMQYLVMASHRADVCIFFTQKILQLLYKHHHRQMAQEVFVSFLAWFCRVSAKCASELSEWFLYRDDDVSCNIGINFRHRANVAHFPSEEVQPHCCSVYAGGMSTESRRA